MNGVDPAVVFSSEKLRGVNSVVRAENMTERSIRYILGAGGRKPNAPLPTTIKAGIPGCDCIGFICWCLGIDRYQPQHFHLYDGWMNTDSVYADAHFYGMDHAVLKAKNLKCSGMWEVLDEPEVGCIVIYPGRTEHGKRVAIGHVGLVVEVPAEWPENFEGMSVVERVPHMRLVKVIDCAAAKVRRDQGRAVGERDGVLWSRRDAVFIRFRGLPT